MREKKKRREGEISLKEKYKEAVKVEEINVEALIEELMEENGLSEEEAKKVVQKIIKEMKRAGEFEEEWVPDFTRSQILSLAQKLTEEVWNDERLHKVIDEMKYFSGQLHPYKLLKFACFLVMLDHIPWDKKHELLLEYAIAINSPRTVLKSQDYVRVNLLIPRSHYVFFKDLLKELKKASRWKREVSLSGLIADSLHYLILEPRDLVRILRTYPDKYLHFLFWEDLEDLYDEIERRLAERFLREWEHFVNTINKAGKLMEKARRGKGNREKSKGEEISKGDRIGGLIFYKMSDEELEEFVNNMPVDLDEDGEGEEEKREEKEDSESS